MRGTLKERFWAKVDKKGPDDCWEWTGASTRHGYGQICIGGHGRRLLHAHRVSWELHKSLIPEGMCVLHRYDNRGCVNPAHLFLGTQTDNMRDRNRKDRQARGEADGMAKLTEQDVREIRVMLARKISQRVIAKKYDVDQTNISAINTGKTWAWLK